MALKCFYFTFVLFFNVFKLIMNFFILFPMKLQPSRRFERTTWFTQLRHSGILLPNNLMKLQPLRRFERTTWFTQLRHSGILLPNNLTVVQLAQNRHSPARRCICMTRHYKFKLLSHCYPLIHNDDSYDHSGAVPNEFISFY